MGGRFPNLPEPTRRASPPNFHLVLNSYHLTLISYFTPIYIVITPSVSDL